MFSYQQPTYTDHKVKTLNQQHIRKNLFNVEKDPVEVYAPLEKSIDKLY